MLSMDEAREEQSAQVVGEAKVARLQTAGRPPRHYTTPVMERVIGRVSNGETLSKICAEDGMPDAATFRRWVALNPALREAWEAAKELRAHSYFEKAIDMADQLLAGNWKKDDGNLVRALDSAINTFKWAAGRLNPRDYGERVPVNPVVPIQIITSLNLDAGKPQLRGTDVYDLRAVIVEPAASTEASAAPLRAIAAPKSGD